MLKESYMQLGNNKFTDQCMTLLQTSFNHIQKLKAAVPKDIRTRQNIQLVDAPQLFNLSR